MTSEKNNSNKDVDIYRETPIRYLGYANEVGESFRTVVHVNLVRFSYLIASAYVCGDALSKGKNAYKNEKLEKNKTKNAVSVVCDVLLWQSFASVIIPGFTINRICYLNGKVLKKFTRFPISVQKSLVIGIGLFSIPLIIHPIDQFVDWAMDNSYRKFKSK